MGETQEWRVRHLTYAKRAAVAKQAVNECLDRLIAEENESPAPSRAELDMRIKKHFDGISLRMLRDAQPLRDRYSIDAASDLLSADERLQCAYKVQALKQAELNKMVP